MGSPPEASKPIMSRDTYRRCMREYGIITSGTSFNSPCAESMKSIQRK